MRDIEANIKKDFFSGRAIIVVGPRQVGKTTLVERIVSEYEKNGKIVARFNCDNPKERELLEGKDYAFLKSLIGEKDIIFIDEGQKVSSIGQTLKIMVDAYKNSKQIIVTGSSSFNLLNQTVEPLTGRKFVYHLYPLSIHEIMQEKGEKYAHTELETLLRFGTYPSVVNTDCFDKKIRILDELVGSQLYKDILEFQNIKNPNILNNLLKALALQVGSQVSYTELAEIVGIDKNTVERYVDLLEKNFVIFRLPPYYSNKRTELKKLNKIYFYDVGVRNSIIRNFNTLDIRSDTGQLWENFLIVERLKKREYKRIYANQYFWRTYNQKEIDLVEERDGKLFGYEFKWSARKLPKPPKDWVETYKNASYEVITPENYLEFVL